MNRKAEALGLIAESLDQVVWLLEWPSLRVLYLSPAFERVWGLSVAQAMAEPELWLSALPESDREDLLARVPALVEAGHFETDFRVVRPDGGVRWLRAEGRVVRGEAGEPDLLAGTTMDITELHETSAALARREAMHERWMQSARDFVVYRLRQDPATPMLAEVEFVSPSLERVLGVPADAPFERWFMGIHPDDRERVEAAHLASAQSGVDFDEIMRIRHPETDGWVWVRAISSIIDDPETGERHANGLIIDISDRMHAESENRLKSNALAYSLNGYFIADETGRPFYANRAFLDMFGYEAVDSVRELSPDAFIADADTVRDVFASLAEDGADLRELTARRRDGSTFEILAALRTFVDMDGQTLLMGTLIDVTERKRAEAELRRAATVFESTAEGVMITDTHGDIVAVNAAFCTMTGYTEEEVLGRSPRLLRSERHGEGFFARMQAALDETGHWRGEVWNRRHDGEALPVWLTVSRVDDPQTGEATSYVSLMADISAMKRSEAQLHEMAHHDALTRLPNRLLLDARLEHALERARRDGSRVAVLFLDVDRFKNVNDTLGHPVGDELLCEVATRLRRCVREEDTVARIGGDEFVVVLESVRDRHYAAVAAEKIISAMSGTLDLGSGSVVLTASVGVVLYPDDGEDATTLLKHADAAMYRAKEDGRDQYQFYTRDMTAGARKRLSLEVDMRRALDRGDQFTVHYQPLVSLEDERAFGVEALMRWDHPERGRISPAEFIPLAEECGLIEPLGEWVLAEACRQLRAWRDAGLDGLRASVNVSGRQVVKPRLIEVVRRVLADTGLDPGALVLELTETVLMSDPAAAGSSLRQLASLGVSLSVDDFGTGYSSLSYLKRFPVSTLKIDRSFVRDAPVDASDAAICRAVLALADSLGLDVVAEGVETVAHRTFLREAGCPRAQGYLFGRPLPAAEAEAALRRNFLEHSAAVAGSGRVTVLRLPGD